MEDLSSDVEGNNNNNNRVIEYRRRKSLKLGVQAKPLRETVAKRSRSIYLEGLAVCRYSCLFAVTNIIQKAAKYYYVNTK